MKAILSVLFLAFFSAHGQKSLIPFCGGLYEKSGISCKEVELEVEGSSWISNVLPIGQTLEINVEEPAGFLVEDGLCYPGVGVLVKRANGDTLGYAPNIFSENEGLEVSTLRNLSFSFSLQDSLRPGDQCRLETRFFDTRSRHYLLVELDFVMGAENSKQTTNMQYTYSSNKGYEINSTVEISDITQKDSLIGNEFFRVIQIEGIKLGEEEFGRLNEKFQAYTADFSRVDASGLRPKMRVVKSCDNASQKCTVSICIPKNHGISAASWKLRLENNEAGQILEISNTF